MRPQQSLRIDLGELKSRIVKKLGTDRSKWYFFYLNRFLSQKLSKNEFDKLCCRVLGRENLQLHNQLIRSILKNACQAKTAPPVPVAGHSKPLTQSAKNSPVIEDGNEDNGAVFPTLTQNIPIWSNGGFPVSPRKSRSGIRDRRLKDRPSPLGPNGKVECVSHQSAGKEDSGGKIMMGNGDGTLCDYQRPVQHLQAVAGLPENNIEAGVQQPATKQVTHSKIQVEGTTVEDREEAGQLNHLSLLRSHLLAPLGIPFCSASIGAARKARPIGCSGDFVTYYDSGYLSDTETLRQRMEQIAAVQGLGSVSADCANILNKMLDVYLKQLIRSCADLVRAQPICESKKHLAHKQEIQGKIINGMLPNNQLHMRHGNGNGEVLHEHRLRCSISLLDFKVAMELNPKQLGEDWPLLLEKICMRAFDE